MTADYYRRRIVGRIAHIGDSYWRSWPVRERRRIDVVKMRRIIDSTNRQIAQLPMMTESVSRQNDARS